MSTMSVINWVILNEELKYVEGSGCGIVEDGSTFFQGVRNVNKKNL
jgi:hypothetical protein